MIDQNILQLCTPSLPPPWEDCFFLHINLMLGHKTLSGRWNICRCNANRSWKWLDTWAPPMQWKDLSVGGYYFFLFGPRRSTCGKDLRPICTKEPSLAGSMLAADFPNRPNPDERTTRGPAEARISVCYFLNHWLWVWFVLQKQLTDPALPPIHTLPN